MTKKTLGTNIGSVGTGLIFANRKIFIPQAEFNFTGQNIKKPETQGLCANGTLRLGESCLVFNKSEEPKPKLVAIFFPSSSLAEVCLWEILPCSRLIEKIRTIDSFKLSFLKPSLLFKL
jgi:hypothetical protein